MELTRRYRFSSSHRLHAPAMPADWNEETYGKCNNPYGHGHDYVLEVCVAGEVDPRSGRLIDLPALDRLVHDQVVRPFDHHDLNADVPEFSTLVPTSENLVLVIEHRLREEWPRYFGGVSPRLHIVRLEETPRNRFEWKR